MNVVAALVVLLQQGLSGEEFQKLHKDLAMPREAWLTIPWKVSVQEAREQAFREKKPIFLWSEAGNPLGCT